MSANLFVFGDKTWEKIIYRITNFSAFAITWSCLIDQALIALICYVNQALVDAPDMVRCQMNFKRLSLTDIKIDIKRVPKKTTLIKAMEEAGNDKACAVL